MWPLNGEVVAIGKGHWHGRYLAEVDDQTVEARGDKDDRTAEGCSCLSLRLAEEPAGLSRGRGAPWFEVLLGKQDSALVTIVTYIVMDRIVLHERLPQLLVRTG